MKSIYKLFILSFILFGVKSVSATHLAGSEITYKHLNDKTYEITVKISTTLSGDGFNLTYSCNSSLYAFSKTTYKSSKFISNACDSTASSLGFLINTYKDTVNFSDTSFSRLLACSDNIKIQLRINARYVTSIVPGGTMDNYSIINVDAQKSSVQLTNDPLHFVCCNVPTRYSMGVQKVNSTDIQAS